MSFKGCLHNGNPWNQVTTDVPKGLGPWKSFEEAAIDALKYDGLVYWHDWSIEGSVNPPPVGDKNSGYFIHGIGWYRQSFPTPPDTLKKVVIEFDAVYMNSEVWINGQFLGQKPYGFIGFRYDIKNGRQI